MGQGWACPEPDLSITEAVWAHPDREQKAETSKEETWRTEDGHRELLTPNVQFQLIRNAQTLFLSHVLYFMFQ